MFAKGSVTGGDAQQASSKGSDSCAEFQRVRAFGHVFAKLSDGFALLDKICRGFPLFATRSLEPRKGSHFWCGPAKGSHF